MFNNFLVSIILLALVSGCGYRPIGFTNWEQWSTYDKAAYGAAWVARGADILQTRYVYDHPNQFEETNFIVNGLCDNKDCATAVLVGSEILVGLAVDKLPPTWRSGLLTFEAGKNAALVFNADSIGVKFAW